MHLIVEVRLAAVVAAAATVRCQLAVKRGLI
jgi:hypothetical protein